MIALSRNEFYHVAIGLTGISIWLFGQKFGLPADAVTFAQTVTIGVVGHAVGLNSKEVVPPPSSSSPDLPASKE